MGFWAMQTCAPYVAVTERGASLIEHGPKVVSDDVINENRRWVQSLSGSGEARKEATDQLYLLLTRVARTEAVRRSGTLWLTGPELDDVAHQAASDALLRVCAKIDTFRGECRFTTWAYRFAAFDVGSKLNRHFWRRDTLTLDAEEWDTMPSTIGIDPELEAEARDLAEAVCRAVSDELTARQRAVFVAVAIDGTPMAEVAHKLGSTSNAIYKTMFDARRKLRTALEMGGYLPTLTA